MSIPAVALGPDVLLSYGQLVRRGAIIADRLREALGLAPSDRVKTIVYGGGPMYLADLDRAHDVFGHRLAQIYGQGESRMCITALDKRAHAETTHPRCRERLASVGMAQLVVEVRVADEHDRPLPAGETREVLVRGDSVMHGYWRNAEASVATLTGCPFRRSTRRARHGQVRDGVRRVEYSRAGRSMLPTPLRSAGAVIDGEAPFHHREKFTSRGRT